MAKELFVSFAHPNGKSCVTIDGIEDDKKVTSDYLNEVIDFIHEHAGKECNRNEIIIINFKWLPY